MGSVADTVTFIRICIDDLSNSRFTDDTYIFKLMNRAATEVANRLYSDLGYEKGYLTSDIYEFVANTQEIDIIYPRIKFIQKFDTDDTTLLEDIYPILDEETAKKSEYPCFYVRQFTKDNIKLGYYRIPNEGFKIRIFYYLFVPPGWSDTLDLWALPFDEQLGVNCIGYKVAMMVSMTDQEQRSVWENEYEKTYDILLNLERKTRAKEVVDVEGE